MSRELGQQGWIGLTLTLGMVTGAFLPVSTLAQVNSSSSTSDSVSQCTSTQIPLWINRLAVGDVAAFDALVNCGSIAVPYLIKGIDNEDLTIILASIAILGEMGEEAKDAIPVLIELFRQTETPTLIIGNKDLEVISVRLNDLFDDGRNDEIKMAIYALAKIGKPAIPALIAALEDENWGIRSNSAKALGYMGEKAKAAIPALISALEDEDSNVRSSAADALGEMGEEAKAAIPALISALNDEDSDVRSSAVYALGEMGEEAKRDKFVRLLLIIY